MCFSGLIPSNVKSTCSIDNGNLGLVRQSIAVLDNPRVVYVGGCVSSTPIHKLAQQINHLGRGFSRCISFHGNRFIILDASMNTMGQDPQVVVEVSQTLELRGGRGGLGKDSCHMD